MSISRSDATTLRIAKSQQERRRKYNAKIEKAAKKYGVSMFEVERAIRDAEIVEMVCSRPDLLERILERVAPQKALPLAISDQRHEQRPSDGNEADAETEAAA